MAVFYGNPTSLKALKSVIDPKGVLLPRPPKGIDPYCEKHQGLIFYTDNNRRHVYGWNLMNLPKYGMNISDFEGRTYSTVFLTVENLSDTLKFMEEILEISPYVEKIYLLSDQKYDVDEYEIVESITYSELKNAVEETTKHEEERRIRIIHHNYK